LAKSQMAFSTVLSLIAQPFLQLNPAAWTRTPENRPPVDFLSTTGSGHSRIQDGTCRTRSRRPTCPKQWWRAGLSQWVPSTNSTGMASESS
jgi:hypothetical protein